MVDVNAIKQTVCRDAHNVYASAIRVGSLQKANNVIRIVVGVDKNLNLLPFVLHNKTNNVFYSMSEEVARRGLQNNYVECLRQLVSEKQVVYQHLTNIQYFVVIDVKCKGKNFVKKADGTYAADVGYFVRRSVTNTISGTQVWNLGKVTMTPTVVANVNKVLISRILELASVFVE